MFLEDEDFLKVILLYYKKVSSNSLMTAVQSVLRFLG